MGELPWPDIFSILRVLAIDDVIPPPPSLTPHVLMTPRCCCCCCGGGPPIPPPGAEISTILAPLDVDSGTGLRSSFLRVAKR
ncbi:MAG: hypothetical protein MJE68_09265 [Proteobacteria bacterium]|nr:hypothetical protein [Pseudomonadota bacterium]